MNTTEPFFEELKKQREDQKIEISEISDRTKILPKYFEAIEKGDFNILPSVYMRLFIRSYAIEIGADDEKALVDFGIYWEGKSKSKVEPKPISDTEIDNSPAQDLINELAGKDFLKKIIYGIITVIAIIVLIAFVSKLTRDQTGSNNQLLPEQTDTIEPATQTESNDSNSEPSVRQTEPDEPIEEADFQLTEILSRQHSNVFTSSKRIGGNNEIINITPPFTFSLKSNTPTKISITSDNSLTYSGTVALDSTYNFQFNDTLYFDFWNARNLDVFVNENSISDNFITHDVAIRGSLTKEGIISLSYFRY